MRRAPTLLGLLVLVSSAASAQEVLVSNFQAIHTSTLQVHGGNWMAAGFVSDGQERELASVKLGMGAPLPGIVAELWSGDEEPDAYVASFGEGPPSIVNTFIWEPLGSVTLQPNGTYWMLLAYPVDSMHRTIWLDTTDSSTEGPGALVKPLASLTQGATWQTLGGNINRRLRIEVEVPEPSGPATAASALVAVGALWRARSGSLRVSLRS